MSMQKFGTPEPIESDYRFVREALKKANTKVDDGESPSSQEVIDEEPVE